MYARSNDESPLKNYTKFEVTKITLYAENAENSALITWNKLHFNMYSHRKQFF